MSPSTRGCGLKLRKPSLAQGSESVTLYARVWIEIGRLAEHLGGRHVSTRGCGLKFIMESHYTLKMYVTLYARVWIEIRELASRASKEHGHPLREGVD